MKKFLFKLSLFIIIPVCIYVPFSLFVLPNLLEYYIGPSIEQQLEHSFSKAEERDYDMVILGNSRLFCGVNPDKFNIGTFNFSHNNDSYNQLYYKLIWLKNHNKKIDYVILGVDYFQFGIFSDSRNYAYSKYLDADYDKDYPKKNYKLYYYKDLLRKEKLLSLFKNNEGKYSLKDNGQYVRYGKPENKKFIPREFKPKKIQEEYFKKIISYCNNNHIKVFLVMPPLRPAELKNYSAEEIASFNKKIEKYVDGKNNFYFDFSNDKRYKWNDFIDFTHLNQKAADRFSMQLNDSINTTLQKNNDI